MEPVEIGNHQFLLGVQVTLHLLLMLRDLYLCLGQETRGELFHLLSLHLEVATDHLESVGLVGPEVRECLGQFPQQVFEEGVGHLLVHVVGGHELADGDDLLAM